MKKYLIALIITLWSIPTFAGVTIISDSSATTNLTQINGVAVDVDQGNASTGTIRVAVADDDTNLAAIVVDLAAIEIINTAIQVAAEIMDDWDDGANRANTNADIESVGGAAVNVNGGNRDTGTQTIALADDDPAAMSLGAIETAVEILDDWDESDRAKANIIVGQAGITAGAGAVAANTPRMTLASDDPAVAHLNNVVTSVQIMDDWDDGANRANVNSDLETIVGNAVNVNGGNRDTGTQTVTLADNDPAVTDLAAIELINTAVQTSVEILDNIVYAEDSGHSDTDPGNMILAVRQDTQAALAGTDGDYIPLTTNASGAVYTEIEGYVSGTNSNRVEEIDPVSAHYVASSCHLENILNGTPEYCTLDMDGFTSASFLWVEENDDGDTFAVTVECSNDGTNYVPCTQFGFTAAHAATAANYTVDGAAYMNSGAVWSDVRVKITTAGGNETNDYYVYARKAYGN